VFQYRLKNEYNVEIIMEGLPYESLRWIDSFDGDIHDDLIMASDMKLVEDYKGNNLILFSSPWSIKWTCDKNPSLKLSEFGGVTREEYTY
jgi:peptide chain release factor 3